MAQHPAAVTTNNNEKFRSFKSKENIHKKEVGPYCDFIAVSAIKASSVTLTWQKEPVENTVIFAIFNMAVVSKTDIRRNYKIFQISLENESKRMINFELSEYIP